MLILSIFSLALSAAQIVYLVILLKQLKQYQAQKDFVEDFPVQSGLSASSIYTFRADARAGFGPAVPRIHFALNGVELSYLLHQLDRITRKRAVGEKA